MTTVNDLDIPTNSCVWTSDNGERLEANVNQIQLSTRLEENRYVTLIDFSMKPFQDKEVKVVRDGAKITVKAENLDRISSDRESHLKFLYKIVLRPELAKSNVQWSFKRKGVLQIVVDL